MGNSLEIREIQKTLNKLISLIDHYKTIKRVAKILGYTYSYIHQVSSGKLVPGVALIEEIGKLHTKTFTPTKPRDRRIGVFVDLPTIEDKEKVLKLSMEERARRLSAQ